MHFSKYPAVLWLGLCLLHVASQSELTNASQLTPVEPSVSPLYLNNLHSHVIQRYSLSCQLYPRATHYTFCAH